MSGKKGWPLEVENKSQSEEEEEMKKPCPGRKLLSIILLMIVGISMNLYLSEVAAQTSDELNKSLIDAAKNGNIVKVKELISRGADVNAKTNQNATALIYASLNGHTETVKELIAKGADLNAKTNEGFTAIMYASQNGHTDVVKELIEKGADVNAKTNNGFTALTISLSNGHTDIVKMLLTKGAVRPKPKVPSYTLKKIQIVLSDLGYNPGPADGQWGNKTRRAIQALQKDGNMEITGEITKELFDYLDKKLPIKSSANKWVEIDQEQIKAGEELFKFGCKEIHHSYRWGVICIEYFPELAKIMQLY